jgi:hypothetical protein
MEIDNTTNPVAAEVEATEVEQEEPSLEAEAANDGDEPDSQADEPEFEELEVDGKLYKVPKEIAPHVMKNADYTQKTQALAEQRRQWEESLAQERETIQRESEIFETLKSQEAQRIAIEGRIEALRGVNINALPPQDQLRYNNELMQLQWAHGDIARAIDARREELVGERERQFANTWQRTVQSLSQPDEKLGWSGRYDESTQASLAQFMRDVGVNDDNRIRATLAEPVAAKVLNLAKIGLATLQKQKAALSAKPKQAEAKPVPTVSGAKAKGNVDPDKLSPGEWVKWREKQLARQAG